MSLKRLVVGVGSVIALTLVACGGADEGSDFNGTGNARRGGGGDDAPEGTIGGPATTPAAPANDLAACATATAAAEAKPVTLVFAYDKSGSMKDNSKWSSAKTAMKAFFTSADAKGVSASLTFFPNGSNICSVGNYTNPQVPLAALPSADFGAALDSVGPNGSTPTLSALSGAITHATALKMSAAKDSTIAIVLVTDGIPQGCNDDGDPAQAAAAAMAASASFKTYVVGVGNALGALNAIAVGGGTNSAFVVSVGDPTKTQQDLTSAINKIRASALSCDYKIPAAPNGETFDRNKVNVQYTPAGGAAQPVGYNPTCAGGVGWKYDDEAAPTRVLACEGTCDTIKAASGKVDIVFGCATRGTNVN